MEEKRELLYSAISDAQEIIRHIDVKTEVGLTILLAAFAAFITQTLSSVLPPDICLINLISFSIISVSWLTCGCIAFSILLPQSNPVERTELDSDYLSKTAAFYLFNLTKVSIGSILSFNDRSLLLPSQKDLLKRIKSLSEEDILEVLSAELIKVSYIREVKLAKAQWFFRILLLSLSASFVYYIMLQFKFACCC